MRKLILFLVLFTLPAWATTATVTGTVQDPTTQVVGYGTVIATLNSVGIIGPFRSGGVTVPPLVTGVLTSGGAFSITLTTNTSITPAGTQWNISVCAPTGQCSSALTTTISGNVDLSAQISALMPTMTAAAVQPFPFAFSDSEIINPTYGSSYFNLTTLVHRFFNGTTWSNIIGAGLPSAATYGQVPVSTAAGTGNYVAQNKPVIDVRDLSGVDCTGVSDSSVALNALTDGTNAAVNGARISFLGCGTVRLNHTWVVKFFSTAPEIDLGPLPFPTGSTRIIGCVQDTASTGLFYVPIILFERTGQVYLHGGATIVGTAAECSNQTNNTNANIGIENDATTYPSGVTTTRWRISNHAILARDSGTGPANWQGIVVGGSSIYNQNLEAGMIDNNIFNGQITSGSVGVDINSVNSDHGILLHNNFQDLNYGVQSRGPQWVFEANNFSDVANKNNFATHGCIFQLVGTNLVFINNEAAEATGQFMCIYGASQGPSYVTMINGNLGGEDGGLAAGTPNIDCGQCIGTFFFVGVRGNNINGDPIINWSVNNGGGAVFVDAGNRWISEPFRAYDGTQSANFMGTGTLNSQTSPPTITNPLGYFFRTISTTQNTPAINFELTNQATATGHEVTRWAIYNTGARQNIRNGLQIVQATGAQQGSLTFQPALSGGLQTVSASAAALTGVSPIGATGATTWAYSVVAYSTSGLTYVYPTVSIVNGAATLNGTNYNRITVKASAEYWKYCIRRETAGGTPNTTGLLSTAGPNSNGCLNVATMGGQNQPTWGYGGEGDIYFFDTGFTGDNSAAPPFTADGRIVAAGGLAPSTSAGLITYYKIITHAALDLLSVASGACTAEQSETISGAAFGDHCSVEAGTALEAGGFFACKVTAANTVKWQFCNLSGGAIDRASDTYTIRLIR